ncbi:MAG: PilT/PilU family type 4a pilus ATPase [Deltaproteobacteria bacterium]|nr:PilT/PilU family type 4a pilus ATPase [Deltaproteobacteria bacterium]MBM4393646.1 PilT/PilU family type 4a pilus ATPase [Deltaproteobacteria bacterium]
MATDLVSLLGRLEAAGASDLFVTVGKPPAARVHGHLRTLDEPPTTAEHMDQALGELLLPAARARFAELGELDVGVNLPSGRRVRVSLLRQQGSLGFVARAVPPGAIAFGGLGLPASVAEFVDEARGLVLVTGATGSGKSTTLAALVHHINQGRAAHIVTIEDPIEFVHRDLRARITQREVGTDSPSFESALRQVVRQSPDVILVGEMRDVQSMGVAISAALTGHLVLASIHAIDTTQTLQRILAYFPDQMRAQAAVDLSLCLVGIVSQRLLPRPDGRGRALACEVLANTPAVSRLLREQRVAELQDLMRGSTDPKLLPFNQSLLRLHRAGAISYEAGLAAASNPDEFALLARGMASGTSSFRAGADQTDHGLDLQALLVAAEARGASDLHLTAGRPPIVRVNGVLSPLDEQTLSEADVRTLLYSVMSARQRAMYELDREVDFALQVEGGRRFRVNAYYQKGQMAAALRAIAQRVPTADELGLPESLVRLGDRPQGLLLVVGPTGAGKSTTLACLVDRVNQSRACRILTVEDPIEFVHESKLATIDQREVGADTAGYAAALKYILRQDPDVVLVGEMRDPETIAAALTAAETGHLVLATLHANDAPQTVDRIVDAFPSHQQDQARAQLSACLLGVISQRLLPHRSGVGRTAVFEVMLGSPAVRTLIRDDKLHQLHNTMETARREGMVTMDHALKEAYEAGRISFEDAMRFVVNPRTIVPVPGR